MKVQYEDFNFKVLTSEHFRIYHYPREFRAVKDLAAVAELWYDRHSTTLKHGFDFKNPLILYANHADFQQTDIIRSQIGVGTGGVTEGRLNRVIMPFAEANTSTNHVLGHELVHAFQYDMARKSSVSSIRATSKLPLWFIEGMAEYLSIGPRDSHTAMWMRDAVLHDDVPSIKQVMKNPEYFPYRYGHSIWSYMAGRWGDDSVSLLYLASLKKGLNGGVKQVLGIPVDSVSTLWRNAIKDRYQEHVKNRSDPGEVGKQVLGPKQGTGSRNFSPTLSPNGEYVTFISSRSMFSMELYLADAQTGEVIRKLTRSVTNPHLNALRFIESAGSWAPDNRRFAFVVFSKGDNQINVIDVKTGEITRKIRIDSLGAFSNPSWSPDGNRIAFTASKGGYSDLYIYNLKKNELNQLTNDRYSDLQPAWSPDGERLAFVTDRGTGTSFREMTFGNMGLALYELDEGEITTLSFFDGYKHINPQFGLHGENLFFISDFEGFSNVFRYNFKSEQLYQVTNVSTGISGISKFSPAMSISRETGRIMVSVFDDRKYSGYSISSDSTRGRPIHSDESSVKSEMLPPVDRGNQQVLSYLREEPGNRLRVDTSYSLSDYDPTLGLTYIGGGGRIGLSGNQMDTRVGGGITTRFSDVLNQHTMYANIMARGQIKDMGGEVGYINKDRRYVWGGSISHFPFTSSTATSVDSTITVEIGGEEKKVNSTMVSRLTRRIFEDRMNLQWIYPFSTSLRFESNINYTRISYDYELRNTFLYAGETVERQEKPVSTPAPINLAGGSAALVGDNSVAAFTGPIMGHRFRFEVEPTTGSFSYISALADYRRYVYLKPFTLAFRLLHRARYATDEKVEELLTPFNIGFERLMRGYNLRSFQEGECTRTKNSQCAEVTRLFGNRLGVFNMEFRIPLVGAESISFFETNFLPTTVSPFFDGGVAWTPAESPELMWETDSAERIPVFSTGVSVRMNIMGYVVTELYFAYPFQRPEKGGFVGFQLSPGW